MAIKPALLTILTAGTIGGGATGAYFLLKPDTPVAKPITQNLAQVLSAEGFEALSTDSNKDDVTWGKLIDKHLEANFNAVTKINVPNLKTNDPTTNRSSNIEALKLACKTMLSKTSNYEGDKATAKNWCNKNTTIITR